MAAKLQPAAAQGVTFSTIASDAYATGDVNSCAVGLNNITSDGTFQFVAYYDSSRTIQIARRTLGASTWQTFSSGYTVSATDIADDHDVVGIAVDSAGKLHMSWNMHNVSLNYAISSAPVTTPTLSSIAWTTQTAANAPTLFPSGGTTTNEVTYPQFYKIPGSSNLLFTYRNGGAGGGSGNGNQFFNVYTPATNTWTNRLVINGEQTSVNGYLNSLAYTSSNNLLMSWTWRAAPSWQTNSNVMFAQSPDNGTSWFRQGGTTAYTLPIIQSGTPVSSVAQVIKSIPQNSSLINQTSMTVDHDDNPLIGTFWTPNWNVATSSGDPNRQYMLVYYTGTQWATSQVSRRTSDTAIDSNANAPFVRDLGRPIVLTDDQGRVLMVTRSTDSGMGAFANVATTDNEIVVYYNTTESLRSATPDGWRTITIDTANMGSWEPTYDANLWQSQRKLSLFYEPMGLGSASAALRALDWDEQAYFSSLNSWNVNAAGNWDTAGNWATAVPNAAGATASLGTGIFPTSAITVTLNGTKIVGTLNFDSPTFSYNLASGTNGALALNNRGVAAALNVYSGTHTLAVPVALSSVGNNVSVASSSSLTISGAMTGSGGIAKSGAGTLFLSGSNSYSGSTIVTGGILRIGASSSLSSNSNLTLNGGVLAADANISRALGTGSGQIQITGGTSGFSAGAADVTFTFTNSLTWGGSTFNPTALLLNTTTSTHDVTLAATINLNSAARLIQPGAGLATLSGVISSTAGSLNVDGAGTLVLSNSSNSYGGGTLINSIAQGPGVVRATASNALGTGAITTGPQGNLTTARLELASATGLTLPNPITFTGRNTSSVAIENLSGSNTLSGPITLTSGGATYLIQSDAGTLNLTNTIAANAPSDRNLTLQGAGNGLVSGAIQNGNKVVSLTKAGIGVWTLSVTNSYTGSTVINGGKLLVNGSISGSATTVNSGGTLGGTGAVGTVTINAGGTLAPGASIESLGSGSNIWKGGGALELEVSTDGSTGTAGSQWDLLAITGGLDLSDPTTANKFTIKLFSMSNATTTGLLASWNANLNHTWAGFVTTTTGITGFDATKFTVDASGFQNATNGGTFALLQSGNNLNLRFTAVPEPDFAAMMLAGFGAMMALQRRRANGISKSVIGEPSADH
ncbi:MAG: hypothetical protein QOE70_6278 [Chthoniobacter sp.]|jgi:autotransporter-associated beta strand protein|nr:hypothetical protein [Chthoniobacter sp.]